MNKKKNNPKQEALNKQFLNDVELMMYKMPKFLDEGYWECYTKYGHLSLRKALKTMPQDSRQYLRFAKIKAVNLPLICHSCRIPMKRGYITHKMSPAIDGCALLCKSCFNIHIITGN